MWKGEGAEHGRPLLSNGPLKLLKGNIKPSFIPKSQYIILNIMAVQVIDEFKMIIMIMKIK